MITNWSDERGLTWYSGQTQCYRIKCEGERIEGAGGTWLPTSDYPYSWEEFCALSDYEEATKMWNEVLESNETYSLAHYNLAGINYKNGDWKAAMDGYRYSNDRNDYSLAFSEYRYEFMMKNYKVQLVYIAVPYNFAF